MSILRGLVFSVLAITLSVCPHWAAAQQSILPGKAPTIEAALPDAPEPRDSTDVSPTGTNALPPAGKYDPVIEPGQATQRLSVGEKLIYSGHQNLRVVNIFSAMYSAGYEQLTGSDPKYGSDSGAGAVKFGASMLLSGTTRTLSDGIFAAAFHQDPRYYRVADGSIMHRGIRSAARALVRRSDDGHDQVNASGLLGRAAAAVLTLAYYPKPSRNARVVGTTFGISIATDAGGDLVLEFLPDLARKFPILKKVELP